MPTLDLNGDQFHYHLDDFSDPWCRDAPVILHHAAGGNLHRWRPWVPTLARHRPVVRFDMRGHAGTRKSLDQPFDLADLATDIARVLDVLGIDKTHLVGASAGGIVSLRFAHDFPDRLLSLTLVASTPKLAQMGANMDAAPWRGILEQQGTRAWLLADTRQEIRFGYSGRGDPVVRGRRQQNRSIGGAGASRLSPGGRPDLAAARHSGSYADTGRFTGRHHSG